MCRRLPLVLWYCWLGVRKSIWPAKNLSFEVLACLSVWSEVQIICMWSSWRHCHPIFSYFIKIQIGLTFLVLAYPGCPGKEAVKQVSVYLSVTVYPMLCFQPFWPIGSGCARGFLGALDTAWMVRSWASGKMTPLEVIAERESIYQLLSQTTPENLNKSFSQHTIDPNTRSVPVNCRAHYYYVYAILASFLLQADFMKITLRHAASVLILDMRIGTFLFPKSTVHLCRFVVLCRQQD